MAQLTKEQFYDFAVEMKNDSTHLFEKQSYHNSVYLAGYVLEAYIKIILIDKNQADYSNHLNSQRLNESLQDILSLYPEYSDSILYRNNAKYPRRLFNGGGNNTIKASWKSQFRYDVIKWSDCEEPRRKRRGFLETPDYCPDIIKA